MGIKKINVKVRKGRVEDIASINPIWWSMQSDHERYDPDYYNLRSQRTVLRLFRNYWTILLSDRKALCIVAEIEKKVVGAAIAKIELTTPVNANKKRAYVDVIFVQKEYRGAGAGKALMAFIEEWARKKGAPFLELRVDSRNSRAKRFYSNRGFNGRQIVMIKEIPSGKS